MTIPSRTPIKVINRPIYVSNRWVKIRDNSNNCIKIIKNYTFNENFERNRFINELFEYEESINHHGNITCTFDEQPPNYTVCIELWTRNIEIPTELDYEYAKFADIIYKDIVYNNEQEK
jgi:pterin-4a-carbinolamine dehydratase